MLRPTTRLRISFVVSIVRTEKASLVTKLPVRNKATAPKKVVVGSYSEVEDLVDPKRKNKKPITDKHPNRKIEFWLDDDPDEPLKLMCLVSNFAKQRRL